MFSRLRKCASTCDYSTFLDRALKEQFTVGLCSQETQLKLLSKEHSLAESIQQAIADEAAVRESANIIPSSTATNSLNFVKRHPPSKKDMKTDKPKHTANFTFHANLKSSANSKFPYTCYSCGHTGHKRNACKFRNSVCHKCSQKGHIASVCNSSKNVHIMDR